MMFNFDFSYLSLPKKFYAITKPDLNPTAKVFILNDEICNKFNFTSNDKQRLISFLCYDINHKNLTHRHTQGINLDILLTLETGEQ